MELDERTTIARHSKEAASRGRTVLEPLSKTLMSDFNAQNFKPSPEIEEKVRRSIECHICGGGGMVSESYEVKGMTQSRAKWCICRQDSIRKVRFQKAVDITPKQFRERHGVFDGLKSLKPRPDVHAKQPQTIEILKKNLEQSFFIFGRTGAHKTTMAWAMLQEAGRLGKHVGGNTGKSLIDCLRNFQIHGTIPKDHAFYSLEQLESNTERFCVLVDDIDGIIISEYTFALLWDLLDKIMAHQHQLIVTSNQTLDNLLQDWVARDRDGKANAVNYVEKLSRRFKEICADIDLR